ncbi:hypothetical protein MASR1M45_04650 [Candidatus Kapaibacterium sp.]
MSFNDKTFNALAFFSIKAAADLPANRFVGFDGNIAALESKSLGVTQYDCSSGDYASVITIGTAVVETSVAVSAGDKLTADENGLAKKAIGTALINGRSLDTISAPGFVRILLTT